MSRDGCMSLTIIACTSRNCSQLYPCTVAVRSVNVRPFWSEPTHLTQTQGGRTCTAWTRVVTHGARRAWARVEIPWIIASIGDVPCWSMSLTIIACTSRNCSQLCPFTVAVRSVNVRPFGLRQHISLRHRGADMYCVDSRGDTWHMSCVCAREDTVDDCQHT